MSPTRRLMVLSALAIGLAVTSLLAFRAAAARPPQHPPTVILAVRLPRVLEGLNEFADAQIKLKKIGDEFESEKNRQKDELKQITDQRDSLMDRIKATDDQAAKDKLIEDYDRLQDRALDFLATSNAWQRYAEERADIERSLLLQNLYRGIRASIQKMAQERGYDLVIVDDSPGELAVNPDSKASRESQIRQQIFDRQILYIAPSTDVTEELIDYMNAAYKAGVAVSAGDQPKSP